MSEIKARVSFPQMRESSKDKLSSCAMFWIPAARGSRSGCHSEQESA